MSKTYVSISAEQLRVLQKNSLVEGNLYDASSKEELQRIINAAEKKGIGTPMEAYIQKIKQDKKKFENLVFARFEHPYMDVPLLVAQGDFDEDNRISQGYIRLCSDEDFVIDVGKKIVVSTLNDEEINYCFTENDMIASSESAAKTALKTVKHKVNAEVFAGKQEFVVSECAECTKGKKSKKSNLSGQLSLVDENGDFQYKEVGATNRENECRGTKIVVIGNYVFEIEVSFYSKDEMRGGIKEEVPMMDCLIYAYEDVIDIENVYELSVQDVQTIQGINIITGKNQVSLVDAYADNGVMLHSLNFAAEEDTLDYVKSRILKDSAKGLIGKALKGDMKNIISYAQLMAYREEKAQEKKRA